jgi:hypothetical protein
LKLSRAQLYGSLALLLALWLVFLFRLFIRTVS